MNTTLATAWDNGPQTRSAPGEVGRLVRRGRLIARAALALATVVSTTGMVRGSTAMAEATLDRVPEPAGAAQVARVPTAELRVLGGTGIGLETAASVLQHRLRIELGARGAWLTSGWLESAAMVRLLGPPERGLWVRGGMQVQQLTLDCRDRPDHLDLALAVDAGLAFRGRFSRGHLLAVEGGLEHLRRSAGFGCNDGGGDARSWGARISLAGQWTLWPSLGLFARASVRTADHMLEISFLPEAMAGLAFDH